MSDMQPWKDALWLYGIEADGVPTDNIQGGGMIHGIVMIVVGMTLALLSLLAVAGRGQTRAMAIGIVGATSIIVLAGFIWRLWRKSAIGTRPRPNGQRADGETSRGSLLPEGLRSAASIVTELQRKRIGPGRVLRQSAQSAIAMIGFYVSVGTVAMMIMPGISQSLARAFGLLPTLVVLFAWPTAVGAAAICITRESARFKQRIEAGQCVRCGTPLREGIEIVWCRCSECDAVNIGPTGVRPDR